MIMTRRWNRRQILKGSLQAAAALAGARSPLVHAQSIPLQPLDDAHVSFETTTETQPWQRGATYKPSFDWTMLDLNIDTAPALSPHEPQQIMQGFGACFNELGWTSLLALNEADREAVLHEFFDPVAGARFSYCRMPIGANDFATEAYTYDEQDGDFELKHFTIDHDRKTLVPFIQAALRHQPNLRLWASPWTPPSWMKRNHFYAEAKAFPGWKDNGIRDDQVGREGEDFFLQEPRYFEAYARYFGRFIDAYQAEGIRIGMVMPQNEFNSAQNFPSCTWTPQGLARFLRYLGPEMEKRGVAIFFGTMERGNPQLLETVLKDKQAARYIQGVGMQWAGKNALPAVHRHHPDLVLFQSEQECGDGKNAWSYTGYCWQLMKHYLRSGANGYMYWNFSMLKGAESTWGWGQNSLVTVDAQSRSYRFNHDYYLLKHLTHSVDVGARRLQGSGTFDDALVFENPDRTLVVLMRNELSIPQKVQIHAGERACVVEMPPDSLGTLTIKAS
jgi:glucosylceramidase